MEATPLIVLTHPYPIHFNYKLNTNTNNNLKVSILEIEDSITIYTIADCTQIYLQ